MIFDFSGVRRLESAATTVGDTFVCAVGDALLEPFWPEGLGIVRGFYSALDASSAIAEWTGGGSRDATKKHFSEAYAQLKTLSAATRAGVLRPNEANYGLAPS